MSFKPVTHVLFDMDGLLLNTEDLYTIGFQKIASKYDKEFTFALKCKIMGMHSREFAAVIIEDLDLPMTVDDFLKETRDIFFELFPECVVMDGAKKLIHHLNENHIPMGLATSSSTESYEIKSKHHKDLFNLLPYKTFGSSEPEIKRGKPYPDIFLVAAAKFPDQPLPEKCLVFEDSLNGIKAAIAAGMQGILIPDPRLPHDMTAGETLRLHSLEDFQPEMFGLPPYHN